MRFKIPEIQPIEQISFETPIQQQLKNGIPVYILPSAHSEIFKLELLFKAGRWWEKQHLVARATSILLKAGTIHKDEATFAEAIERLGAKLKISSDFDSVSIRLYCLKKHLRTLLPLIYEMLTVPAFPQEALERFIKKQKRQLSVQLQKADIMSYRVFTEDIFGADSPYGYNSTPAFYDRLSIPLIKEHFINNYTADRCQIIMVGQIEKAEIDLLNQYLGLLSPSPIKNEKNSTNLVESPPSSSTLKKVLKVSNNSLQASIRIGRKLFSRHHPDYMKFYLTDMVLGGYFGSRLSQNLREDKGYTYSIYSALDALTHTGYFYIHTEVEQSIYKEALKEIYFEIQRLIDEPVGAEELQMLKNYTLGHYLNMLDGALNRSGLCSELISTNTPLSFFEKLVQTTQQITPEQIQETAQKYLKPSDLYEIVAF